MISWMSNWLLFDVELKCARGMGTLESRPRLCRLAFSLSTLLVIFIFCFCWKQASSLAKTSRDQLRPQGWQGCNQPFEKKVKNEKYGVFPCNKVVKISFFVIFNKENVLCKSLYHDFSTYKPSASDSLPIDPIPLSSWTIYPSAALDPKYLSFVLVM